MTARTQRKTPHGKRGQSPNGSPMGTGSSANGSARPKVVARYDYVDESGDLLFQVERVEPGPQGKPKAFRQRRPDGEGGWIRSVKGVRLVPYRLPQVIKAVAAGDPVYIVEGEKDADALAETGVTATCNAGGAGKWKPEYREFFENADVVIVADKDSIGRKHALQVYESLTGFGAQSVKVVQAAMGKDAADHLDEGYEVDEFVPVDVRSLRSAAEPTKPKISPAPGRSASAGHTPQWWVQWALRRLYEDVPDGDLHVGRKKVAYDLAQQMCADGLSEVEGTEAMRLFVESVPLDSEGEPKPYPLAEAVDTLRSGYRAAKESEFQPWASTDDDEKEIEKRVRNLRLHQAARQRLDAEQWAQRFEEPPTTLTLADELDMDDEPLRFTIEELHPLGGNTLLAAQFKAGKTTLGLNLWRSLLDGDHFLGMFPVNRPEGRVAFWNYEVGRDMFRRWVRDVGVKHPERGAVANLRGFRLPIWTPQGEDWAVRWLAEREVSVLVVDPFARAFRGAGSENDNDDVGMFLEALDVIKRRAGVADLFLNAHTGRQQHEEGAEHVRGATVLDDWPDVRWVMVKDDANNRFFRADGRDVFVPEQGLDYDAATRRLHLNGGTRADLRLEKAVAKVHEAVANHPGINSTELRSKVSGTNNKTQGEALREAISRGLVRVEKDGASHRHYAVPRSKISKKGSGQ